MFFEWFVVFGILALFFVFEGSTRQSFAMSFIGGILLMMLGSTLFANGLGTENAVVQDLNSTAKNIDFVIKNNKDVFTYGVGLLFTMIGLIVSGLTVASLYQHNKTQKGW